MSQSDYIKHKRISFELEDQRKLPPVMNAQKYTEYKEYSLENSIYSNTINYDKIIPVNTPVVFGIQYNSAKIQNCPQFTLCSSTNTRLNRKPLTGSLWKPSSQPPILGKHDPIRKKSDIRKLNYCSCVNI